jgi:hypothetical protein
VAGQREGTLRLVGSIAKSPELPKLKSKTLETQRNGGSGGAVVISSNLWFLILAILEILAISLIRVHPW